MKNIYCISWGKGTNNDPLFSRMFEDVKRVNDDVKWNYLKNSWYDTSEFVYSYINCIQTWVSLHKLCFNSKWYFHFNERVVIGYETVLG